MPQVITNILLGGGSHKIVSKREIIGENDNVYKLQTQITINVYMFND